MNILLVTVDSLRADHVGFLGYERPTTPFLDELARESLVFEHAVVAGLPTYYSFPTILASRYPLALGRDVVGLVPGEPTLATVLKAAGYRTAAFLAGNPYLSRHFSYHQGFDHFLDFLTPSDEMPPDRASNRSPTPLHRRVNQALRRLAGFWKPTRALYNELYFRYCMWIDPRRRCEQMGVLRQYPSADIVIDSALGWLREQRQRPFFLWIHLMDPHHPYYPPGEALLAMGCQSMCPGEAFTLNEIWKRGDISPRRLQRYREGIIALYDAGIRWVDEQIKRLVEALRNWSLWDETLFVFTSDHGEEFLEHGGRFHYPTKLTRELINVPLLIRPPSGNASERVPGPFSLIDLAPTVLDIAGISPPSEFVGRSRWRGDGKIVDSESLAITECIYDCRNPWRREDRIRPRLLAIRNQRYKLVVDFTTGGDQLFDLDADPGETTLLAEASALPARRELLQAALDHLRRSQRDSNLELRLRARLVELRHAFDLRKTGPIDGKTKAIWR